MQNQCAEGDLCSNYNCRNLHPPSRWRCDYGPLCFIHGCEGVHPEQCKRNPCTSIYNCNMKHVDACQYGARCSNPNCQQLHPPPCVNADCNGSDCIFLHPAQPKYNSISSLSAKSKPDHKRDHGGSNSQNQNRQNQNQPYAASSSGSGFNNNPKGGSNPNFQSPKSSVLCYFHPNCTKPAGTCPFFHPN